MKLSKLQKLPSLDKIIKNNNHEKIYRGYYKDSAFNAESERVLSKIDTFRRGRTKQSVMVTSAILGEGKSTISSHIALASARNRKSPTLLIDLDLRRPRIHEIFGQNKTPGLAEILSRKLTLHSCIRDSEIGNLKIITSGSLQGNPLNIINAETIHAFFNEIYKYFDFIVVDAPPVIPVSDPLILGKVVDHVVMVVRVGKTPKPIAKRAIEMLKSVEVNILGIVLNDVDSLLPAYYNNRYYKYPYYSEVEESNNNLE